MCEFAHEESKSFEFYCDQILVEKRQQSRRHRGDLQPPPVLGTMMNLKLMKGRNFGRRVEIQRVLSIRNCPTNYIGKELIIY